MAEIVGQYGPQAEQVIGPTARKTAYRYRGTETTPDARAGAGLRREVADAKEYGATKPTPEMQALIADRLTASRAKLGGGEAGIRATRVHPAPRPEMAPAIMQMARARAAEEIGSTRDPNWAEQGHGHRGGSGVPQAQAAQQAALRAAPGGAGNTPPSEGVIIDSQGRLAVQAIGYGDDHYLPFNLKNLQSLKGGEYVRNRSVGGLTLWTHLHRSDHWSSPGHRGLPLGHVLDGVRTRLPGWSAGHSDEATSDDPALLSMDPGRRPERQGGPAEHPTALAQGDRERGQGRVRAERVPVQSVRDEIDSRIQGVQGEAEDRGPRPEPGRDADQ